MIGYLRSRDCYLERLRIGPDESAVSEATEGDTTGLPLLGFFSKMGGRRVLFYRWDGALRLRSGDGLPIDLAGLDAKWSTDGDTVMFTLKRGNDLIWRETYPLSPDIQGIADDPTPMVEAEHFDLFLFVRNVMRDPARANRICRGVED